MEQWDNARYEEPGSPKRKFNPAHGPLLGRASSRCNSSQPPKQVLSRHRLSPNRIGKMDVKPRPFIGIQITLITFLACCLNVSSMFSMASVPKLYLWEIFFYPFSTVTYFFANDSEIDRTILLILVRVYEGYKIKKDILHPFIPHTSF